MQEKIKDALEGKITTDTFNDAELGEYRTALHAQISEKKEEAGRVKKEADEELSKLSGFREAKRAAEEKVAKLNEDIKKKESELSRLGEDTKKNQDQMTQFRSEQVEKAKTRFFKEFEVADTDKPAVEEYFKKLDSGKVDSDFIYGDFVKSFAAANPEKFLENDKRIKELKQNAQDMINHQAGAGGGGKPSDIKQPQKFSESTVKTANELGKTPEAIDKVEKQGMKRKY